ncbi:MAG TPA: 2-amino-4-hydroxy-6-hydroxymethyldihydropteridine diphosphokinase [Puia sp.]|nr:2-amino-4-hydroxy-6-hydroxymethyldihydropteridine diphosphokinase [Puia sp.]
MMAIPDSINKAYLLTGGNVGNRQFKLEQARTHITSFCGEIIQQSAVYETEAWGKQDQPAFLNQALLIKTDQSSIELMNSILQVESLMGRVRAEKYGPRIIDIDILFYNQEIIELPSLQVPHPQIAWRRFVLVPMTEIAPNFIHPILKKTMLDLLKVCPDMLDVKKIIG